MLVKMPCEDEEFILIPQYACALPFWLRAELGWEESQWKHRSLVITSVDGDEYNKSRPLMDFSSVRGQSTWTLYQPEVGRAKAILPAVWSFCDWSKRLMGGSLAVRAQLPLQSPHVHRCTQKLDVLPRARTGEAVSVNPLIQAQVP